MKGIIAILFSLGSIFFTTGPILKIIPYPMGEIVGIICLITIAVFCGIYSRIQ
jgi:uncharacterized membrane protein